MLAREGLVGPLQAFAYAATISAGPWLTSSLALALLGAVSPLGWGTQDSRVFMALVTHMFAFSVIGVGSCMLVAARFLADRLYAAEFNDFAPAFVRLLLPLWAVQAVLAAVFLSGVPIPMPDRVIVLVTYLALNGTWLAITFLSAAHDFRSVAAAFVGGFAVSFACGLYGAQHYGLTGQLMGFGVGVLVTFIGLTARLDREFGVATEGAEQLGGYFRRFWRLALAGFAYNVGLWIDKLLFWHHPEAGEQVAGWLHASPVYDDAMFLAYFTVLPALAIFLMKVETDFYDQYRAYFSAIAARDSLDRLRLVKAEMARVLRRSLLLLLKVQGTTTLVVMLLAPEIAQALSLSWLSVFVFRTGVFASGLQVMHLIVFVLLQYFDFQREACTVAVFFMVANGVGTALAFWGGLPAYGYGFAASSILTLVLGLHLLNRNFRELEYHVFMKQPL